MMKYDYETIREGLIAIEEQTKHIIENKNFEKDEKEKIAQHVFFHLERVGKLAVSRKDEDSVLEVIIRNLNDIGISASNQKLERAALKAVESLGVIGKNVAEQELENATLSVIDSLKWVGVSAAKHELKEAVREAINSLNLIGISAIENRFVSSTVKAASSLGEMGKVSIDKNIRIDSLEAGVWEASFLKEIGVKAAEYKIERAVKMAISSLGELGIEAAKHNLKNTTLNIVDSIEVVGMEATKQKLEKANSLAEQALGWISEAVGVKELKNDDEEKEAPDIIKRIHEAHSKLRQK